jgi:Tol biopolymer transport system component
VYLAEDMRPWVMNADGTNLMPTVDPRIQAGNGRVSFSPDGQYIICNEQSTISGIVKQSADLQTPAQSFLPNGGSYPDWGSDNRIYFGRSPYGLFSVNPDGTDERPLVSGTSLQEVSVSPDGTKMVYADRSQAGHGLYISNTDGTNQQVLVPKGSFYDLRFPDWSPDGSKIVFEGTTTVSGDPNANFRRDLYMVNPDGSNVVNITANRVENGNGPTMPAWGVSPQ